MSKAFERSKTTGDEHASIDVSACTGSAKKRGHFGLRLVT